jgi:hypothetical protein
MGSELTRCPAGDPDAPKVLLAWGTAAGRTWAVMAKPPRPGERWMCWVEGELQADGSSGVATRHVAVGPLRLTGTQWPGRVIGVVTARAARVRVPEPCQVGRRTLRVAELGGFAQGLGSVFVSVAEARRGEAARASNSSVALEGR